MNARVKKENERELQREVAPETNQDLGTSGVRPIANPTHLKHAAQPGHDDAQAPQLHRALL